MEIEYPRRSKQGILVDACTFGFPNNNYFKTQFLMMKLLLLTPLFNAVLLYIITE